MELDEIKGIGEKRKLQLNEAGIMTTEDLLNYFPYKYYDFRQTSPFADDGMVRLIKATTNENAKIAKIRGNLAIVTCKMTDETGHIFTATWYNQTYMKQALFLGREVFLYGKNSPTKKNVFICMLTKFADSFEAKGYLPVYHSVGNIGQKTIHDTILQAIESENITSFVPKKCEEKYKLLTLHDAYKQIHNPESEEMIQNAMERVQIENFIPLLAINEHIKISFREEKQQKYTIHSLLEEFEKFLPFKLTIDQKNACRDIETDMYSRFSMNRLIQGDVGSGKTVVALYGAFVAIKNGYQAAIIAPTEILASQHYETASKLFSNQNITISYLSGNQNQSEKSLAISNIKSGKTNLIIGTHAILSKNVEFKNLSFAVIDEQHRFGVEERKILKNKGITPDIAVMSATPIPRTLALAVYGDLSLTKILSRPKPVQITTNIVIKSKQNDMWDYIKKQISIGSKVFVVCAKIDEENDSDSELKLSAKNVYNFLKTKFDENDLGLIHGKLKKETQNKIMSDFKGGKIKILVSTTIVEVGVDVERADILVIVSPERFGLATLHQLRGRIGRDGNEAHCFCLADNLTEKSYERISYFKNHTNGFDIAEFDLKTRGAGSIFGTNQHGDDNGFFEELYSNSYARAREILEEIKKDVSLHAKVLEKGNQMKSSNMLSKIILN